MTYEIYPVFLEISSKEYYLFDLMIEDKKHSLEEMLEISEMLNQVRKMFRTNDDVYQRLNQFLANLGIKMFNYIRILDPNNRNESITLKSNPKFYIGKEVFDEDDDLTFGLRIRFLFL